jgi:hypothetical protein
MIAEIFGYAIVVAALIGLAAASVELLLAELERPRRFAWLGAFAVALASPPSFWLLAPEPQLPVAVRAGTLPQQPFAAHAQFDWNTALLWLWIVATTILAVLYVAAWLRLALQAKRWPRETSDTVSVVVADDVGPAVLGFLQPRIVLPRWLMDAPATVRSIVVAHELEHIAARDQACIVAAQVITILLPWNLPLWWFVRRLRAAIEIDCDTRVLRRGTNPAEYASVLLAVGQHRPTPAYAALTLIEPVTQLERRIRIMLTQPRSASIGRASAAVAVAVALAACATQLEPPVLVTSTAPPRATDASVVARSEPAADASAASILFEGSVNVRRDPSGQTILRAPAMTMRIGPNFTDTQGKFIFDGNVKFEIDGRSITASRAVIETAPDGAMMLQLTDATLVGPYEAETLLAE